MKHLAAGLGLLIATAQPAWATEWVICSDAGGKASFNVLVGSLGLGTATDFEVHANGKDWATKQGQGTPIVKLQAYEDDKVFMADVSTEDLGTVVAELRAHKAFEGEDFVMAGVLRVPGVGAWAVNCPNE
jgi:hypothetical protein